MDGSRKDPVLSIENVDFVEHGERGRRIKKSNRSENGSDEQALSAQLPLYEADQDERDPLLGTNGGGGSAYSSHTQPANYPYGQHQYYGYDYGAYVAQPPPSPPYPLYQYYDQMGAPIYPPPHQQQTPSSPQMQQSYAQSRHVRSPPVKQQGRRTSPAASPPPQQIRKAYADGTEGAVHPLKRSSRVAPDTKLDSGEDYMVDITSGLRLASQERLPENTTPPRSARSKGSKPPAGRKLDILPIPVGGRPPSPHTRSHRRVSSDGKQLGRHHRTNSDSLRMADNGVAAGRHRRSSSDRLGSQDHGPTGHRRSSSDNRLPPTTSAAGRLRKQSQLPANRRRAYSGGTSGSRTRPSHVRASSLSEVSVATSTSMVSHVTDISKSAFFVGTTDTGKVQLHFPFEYVRLTMDDTLPTGVLFMKHVDEEQYEDYHILNDEHAVPWDLDELHCHCMCAKCSGCTERHQQLSPTNYIMTVEDDLYRRVLDEISASRTMPCGLFFCGHHEDVSQPSILIAMAIVSLFICALVVVAFMTNA